MLKILRHFGFGGSRAFSLAGCRQTAYDSDGKTTVTTLNTEHGSSVMVDTVSEIGFRLNNGILIIGPVVLFRKSVLSWNVQSDLDINEQSLNLFSKIEPKLDILVIGFAGDQSLTMKMRQKLLPFYRKTKINMEILPTEKAASTFNFLSSEARHVAAAMIPPENLKFTYDEIAQTKLSQTRIYKDYS